MADECFGAGEVGLGIGSLGLCAGRLDGIVLKRSWAGEVRNVSLLVAIAVTSEGYREILGICEGAKEDKAGWSSFLKHLKGAGLPACG
jgi:transposase-like protein